jgi:hypothetical protein
MSEKEAEVEKDDVNSELLVDSAEQEGTVSASSLSSSVGGTSSFFLNPNIFLAFSIMLSFYSTPSTSLLTVALMIDNLLEIDILNNITRIETYLKGIEGQR